jgi:OOP family OmpA-OmpF porin
VIADADNDGTPDATDDCPSIPGRKETKGCPDTDGDGIVDKMDDCPDIAGKPVFKGCPDSDGDGISDKTDACPQVMGIAKYNGCPVPDRDGDGFNDEVDQCPDEASNSNKGCPEVAAAIVEEVIEAAKGVNFEKNKSVLTNASFVNLDKIVAILSKNPELKVDIEGHTDNTGSAERNAFLSQQRADVCKKYLVSKGISESRISSVGYGDIKPIADNSTEEGRAQNRRTEFILSK